MSPRAISKAKQAHNNALADLLESRAERDAAQVAREAARILREKKKAAARVKAAAKVRSLDVLKHS